MNKFRCQTLNTQLATLTGDQSREQLVCNSCSEMVSAGFTAQILKKVAHSRGVSVTDIDVSKFKVRVMNDQTEKSKGQSSSGAKISNASGAKTSDSTSSSIRSGKRKSTSIYKTENFRKSSSEHSRKVENLRKSSVETHSARPSFSSRKAGRSAKANYLNRPNPGQTAGRLNCGQVSRGHKSRPTTKVVSNPILQRPSSIKPRGRPCRRGSDDDNDQDYKPPAKKGFDDSDQDYTPSSKTVRKMRLPHIPTQYLASLGGTPRSVAPPRHTAPQLNITAALSHSAISKIVQVRQMCYLISKLFTSY